MAVKRLLTVTILGGFFIFIGGVSAFIVFIKIIESVAVNGVETLRINESRESFMGFIVFAIIPLYIYSIGVGLILQKAWARRSMIFIVPAVIIIFLITMDTLLLWGLLIGLILYYFNQPEVKESFQ